MNFGKTAELMLTQPPDRLDSILKGDDPHWRPDKESFHFSRIGSTLLRAQIDCYHPDLTNSYFDIKSRATQLIRYNMQNEKYEKHIGKSIQLKGIYHSFEKEFYDMARSCLLKYIFQVRIGKMDGIFVSYHNLGKFLGFEYFPLKVIESPIFETTVMANKSYEVASNLAIYIINYLKDYFNSQDLTVLIKTEYSTADDQCIMWIYTETEQKVVHKFKMISETFINDKAVVGSYLLANEQDKVGVYHKITHILGSDQRQLRTEFDSQKDNILNVS